MIEYYATLGANDPIVIEILKGTYVAEFHVRHLEVHPEPVVPIPLPPPVAPSPPVTAPVNWFWQRGVSIILALGLGLLAGIFLFRPTAQPVATPGPESRELRAFWNGFLKSSKSPLVIFSNAEFKGRPETGLRYLDARTDSRDNINDLYTGVGEVLAIAEISRVFKSLDRDVVVKRSGLLSWDETRNRDLIFAGSPTENLSLRDLPEAEGFVFRTMQAGEPRRGDLAVVNAQPRAGEQQLFFASPGLPITEDYAIVAVQPDLHAGQNVMLLAGTTTLGTQAAAEFVSQNDRLETLRKRLNLPSAPMPRSHPLAQSSTSV